MQNFIIKELVTSNIESELEKIGFDIAYRAQASDKFRYKTLKIYDLTIPQANILKQTALSFGADCGLHREVLVNKIEKTDVILGGSYSQLKKICEKLAQQPFSLKVLAEKILSNLKNKECKTKIVGILNVTPNSFSDGGKYIEVDKAIEHFYQLVEDGADMIDIGAESTKPYADPVLPEVQIERLKPILNTVKKCNLPISVDTRDAKVARYALENGATIINDVSGMEFDPKIIDVVAQFNAGIILQHSTFKTEDKPLYIEVVDDVYKSLYEKIIIAKEKGVENIIVDVGIGFGKGKEDCFELLNRIEEFFTLNTPIMVGLSRKSFMNIDNDDNNLKDAVSLALSYPLVQKGVDYIRVHNVKLFRQLLNSVIY